MFHLSLTNLKNMAELVKLSNYGIRNVGTENTASHQQHLVINLKGDRINVLPSTKMQRTLEQDNYLDVNVLV